MRARRVIDGGVVLAVVVVLVRVLPTLDGPTEHALLATLATVFSVPIVVAWRRFPAARPIWRLYVLSGGALALQYTVFLLRPTSWETNGAVSAGITLANVASPVAAGWATVRLARPLLSFAPTRLAVRWLLPLAICGGATSLVLADERLYPDGRGLFGVVVPVAPVIAAVAVGGWYVHCSRPLIARGRTVEIRAIGALLAMLALNAVSTLVDYDRFWSVPFLVYLLLVAVAALDPSAGLAGSPVDFRPVVTPVRFRWAGVAVVPGIGVLVAVELGARPALGVVAVAIMVSCVAVAQFSRDVRSGARATPARAPERLAAVARGLPEALVNRRIELSYQPVVRVHDHAVVGFEALLRWEHPDLGLLDPPDVVRAARWCGLGEELDSHIIEEVSRVLPTVLARLTVDEPYLGVNVSPQTLQVPGFATRLVNRLEAGGRSLDGMVVEIVEDGMVRDWSTLRANVDALQHAGALVALDDFGAGTSNVQYLAEIDVDLVKLDPSLLHWGATDGGRTLQRIVELGRAAGSRVLAEGVESASALEGVRAVGVDLAQGYHLGRPDSLERVLAALP